MGGVKVSVSEGHESKSWPSSLQLYDNLGQVA